MNSEIQGKSLKDLIALVNELIGERENSVKIISNRQAQAEVKVWEMAEEFSYLFPRSKFSGWRGLPEEETFLQELLEIKSNNKNTIAFVDYCESELIDFISKIKMSFEMKFESGVNLFIAE
jgi:hypothetical protein